MGRIRQLGILSLMAWAVMMIAAHSAFSEDSEYELPKYSLLFQQDDIEIRRYEPQLVAEVTVSGDRSDAANQGFRILADYIFGENMSETSMAMTAPVTQLPAGSADIEGRAVVSEAEGSDGEQQWLVRFKMPEKYTQENLPKPTNERINIVRLPAETVAAIRFSGFWTQGNLKEHAQELAAFIAAKKLQPVKSPYYAFYNDPFTWPWNRRNEVIVAIQPESATQFASN